MTSFLLLITSRSPIAMGYLYSAESLNSLRPENARAVLAAACLLGGMDDLCGYAYEMCRQSISVENIAEWLEFVEAITVPSDGTSTPVEPHQMPPSRTAVFGPYAQRLRDDVWHFLVVRLPRILNVNGLSTPVTPQADSAPSDAGRDALLQVYSRVPFELFKAAVESSTFEIGTSCFAFGCHVRGDISHVLPLGRFGSSSIQVCKGCNRAEEEGGRSRAGGGGDSRARVWRQQWGECGAYYTKIAQASVMEGQLVRVVCSYLIWYRTFLCRLVAACLCYAVLSLLIITLADAMIGCAFHAISLSRHMPPLRFLLCLASSRCLPW